MLDLLDWCEEARVQVVTLWMLSTDNLLRPEAELAPLIEIIEDLVDRLAREGLPADELADGQQQLKGQIMLSLESPVARMGRLAGFILHDDHYRPLDEMLADIDAVTAGDIAAVAAEFFPAERQTLVRLGPAA